MSLQKKLARLCERKPKGVKVKMVGLRIIIRQLTGKVISEIELRLT